VDGLVPPFLHIPKANTVFTPLAGSSASGTLDTLKLYGIVKVASRTIGLSGYFLLLVTFGLIQK